MLNAEAMVDGSFAGLCPKNAVPLPGSSREQPSMVPLAGVSLLTLARAAWGDAEELAATRQLALEQSPKRGTAGAHAFCGKVDIVAGGGEKPRTYKTGPRYEGISPATFCSLWLW